VIRVQVLNDVAIIKFTEIKFNEALRQFAYNYAQNILSELQ